MTANHTDHANTIRAGIDSDSGEYGTQDAAHAALDALVSALEAAERYHDEEQRLAAQMRQERDEALELVQAAAAAADTLAHALRRIADGNDPLLGIGSESEFAAEILAAYTAATTLTEPHP